MISRASFSIDMAAKRPSIGVVNDMFKARAGRDLNDNTSRQLMAILIVADALNRAGSTDGTKLRDALAATDIPGDQTIMPWKRLKFDAEGQNDFADPVLIQYLGGKFVTVFPADVAIAAAKWPMNGVTPQTIFQVMASGLLMGLIYALVAVGLSLIFGLMDVVNFAHGEFLMVAMYAMFGLVLLTGLDPILLTPVVAAGMFVFGAFAYLGVVRFAMRARSNKGMVQIFATFGLAVLLQGLAQTLFSPDFRNLPGAWLTGKTLSLGGVSCPGLNFTAASYRCWRSPDFGC